MTSKCYTTIGRSLMGLALVVSGLLFVGCPVANPPDTAAFVDIGQYTGLWYEISKFPQFFQRGLVGVTAEYTLENDGRVRVLNRGFRDTLDGEESSIKGYATVVDTTTNSKLQVRFDPFPACLFPGDYWIIMVGEDYEYAVVSDPTRESLWILSRSPSMDDTLYEAIVSQLAADGFEIDGLVPTLQASSG